MKYTTNKNLKLPEYTDVVDIEDINANFEAVDEHLGASIASDAGAHGFRYNTQDETFEILNAQGEWEEISSAGSGGIALGAVTGLSTVTASGKVFIRWTDPDNIEVDGTVLAEWAGTVLVRKAGSAPANRKDGTIVLDSQTKNAYAYNEFCDSGLTNGVTYYYKLFPYTTAKLYTDSPENAFSAMPNPVKLGNVRNISVTSGNESLQIKWTDPPVTVVSDAVTVAVWASTKVVYKTGSYPTNPDDGTVAINSTTIDAYSSSAYTISGLTNGTTYYIALFPISTDGAITIDDANRITGVPNLIKITTVPSQNGTLTYTGNTQSPSWNNYNTAQLTLDGITSGTNAGSYNATFTPKPGYCWSDGSTVAQTVAWTINKAAGSLALSKTNVTLNSTTLTDTVAVERAGDGIVTATSSNTNVATVSVSGTTITISHVNQATGNAYITVEVAEGTNHNAPNTSAGVGNRITVDAEFVSTTLNDNTWATISAVSASGLGEAYWDVGDRKKVDINGAIGPWGTSLTCYVYILGFNHNSMYEGTGIHFGGFKTALTDGKDICLCDSYLSTSQEDNQYVFNMSHFGNTNHGGWSGCDLRYDILGSTDTAPSGYSASGRSGSIRDILPSDLRAVVKPMTKYTDNTGGGVDDIGYVTATEDYLPLLSEYEITGMGQYANTAEQYYQEQYDYYKSGNSRLKYNASKQTEVAAWWLRSPTVSSAFAYCYVTAGGNVHYSNASYSWGLAPIFKV